VGDTPEMWLATDLKSSPLKYSSFTSLTPRIILAV
jgi:hypothetical protein